jgi:hypothetical protein
MSAITNAVAAWLLTYAVHSTLLLGAAVMVSRRMRSTASRDLVWKVAAFGALLSSALQSVVVRDPRVEPLAGRWEIPSVESAVEPIGSTDLALPVDVRAAEVATRRTPPITAPDRRFTLNVPSWQTALVGLWLGGVMVSLFGLSRRYARARRRFARRFDEADPEILAAVRVLCARIGLRRRVRVTRCEAAHSPVALGRSEICLPEALLRVLSAQQRTSMLVHELAHLDRNDPTWLAAFGWLECVLFFQPLNRIARKAFQEAAEHLCDQYALQHTESPIALAQCLAEVARWLRGDNDPLPYPTMGESLSPLVDRVQRVLSGVREPVTTTLRARWSAVGGVLAFAVIAPVVTDLPNIAQPPSTSNRVQHDKQAALHALERSADAEARALSARYRQKQQSQRDDIANAQVSFPAPSQGDLARRIAAAPDGIVHVTFRARPEACGSGMDEDGAGMFALLPTNDWHPGGPDMAAFYSFDRDDFTRLALSPNPSWVDQCVNGPVHLLLDVQDRAVTNLRIAVGPAPRGVRITSELGAPLSGPEAANYLIELAGRGGQSIAGNAILAAVMAEGNPLLYDKLIRIAADPSRPDRVRQTALHWVALDPAPGAREAIRRHADALPRDTSTRSPVGEPPTALGDYQARLSSVQGMSLDVVVRVVLDERQPLDTRKKAIKWAKDKDISPGALAALYDRLENRELRLFLVQFLADSDDEPTARKLISIAEGDKDNEIRQAARTSLSRHQNSVARAYRQPL